ncbi:glycosyltransferase family 4 protein [Paenibacillus piri]|uniref:Glycosyltransferase family 1 protein n=1 Tax=Paenibacillus piri TaxID=2547395 RepID=A0A4R5KWE5_9BACL|nr:glycosyltransferase family 4 protein [Paenibacillus piri]TDG00324.1 glycosyltransferase family 1 protein [Paenibacillus piri]
MKVAFYNHTSVVSGAEISLLLTAKHMNMAEPVIFAPEGELLERARAAGLETVAVHGYRARLSRNPLRLMLGLLGMLQAGLKFALSVRRHSIDVIHANSLRAGMMAALFNWLHRRPLIWHVRDIPPKGLIGKAINRLAGFAVKAVIGISHPVLDGFDRRKLADRLYHVHNGVSVRETAESDRRQWKERIRHELGIPPNSKVLLIVGQIAPWKRQEDAVRAAKLLLDRGLDAVLLVVGEPKFGQTCTDYWHELHRLAADLGIADRVRFTGFRADVLEICCAADVLWLCSDNEPFGRVIIEAMSQAVPVVATRSGGVPEIIEHGRSGFLYEVGAVKELLHHTLALLNNDERRRQMGRYAAEQVNARFTIETTVSKVEDVYKSVLAPSEPAPSFGKAKEFV